MLQSVDDGHVRGASGTEVGSLAKHGAHLARYNVNSGTGHESRDGWDRNKVDNEPKASQAHEGDDSTNNDRNTRGNNVRLDARELFLGSYNDVSDQC